MHKTKSVIAVLTVLGAALTVPLSVSAAEREVFKDDFSSYQMTGCPKYVDGDGFGQWQVVYTGYGCVRIIEDTPGNKVLEMQPQAVASPDRTSAPLVVGPKVDSPFTYSGTVQTKRQLRQNSPANPWEVAWVVWNYTDDTHFYYFAPKPNGWELGKEDPAYPGAQRFLATGSSPAFKVGDKLDFKIVQNGNTMTVFVNGAEITTFTDNERPYTSGRVGLYSEDARFIADNIKLTSPTAPNGASVPSVNSGNSSPSAGQSGASGVGTSIGKHGASTSSGGGANGKNGAETDSHQSTSLGGASILIAVWSAIYRLFGFR